jgi:hypothetical protein
MHANPLQNAREPGGSNWRPATDVRTVPPDGMPLLTLKASGTTRVVERKNKPVLLRDFNGPRGVVAPGMSP